MATHKQVDKNINDTLSAWGNLQALLSQWMPESARTINGAARRVAASKRRF